MANVILSGAKSLIALLLAISAYSQNVEAQTFLIDSTFTSDAVIQPFGANDTIYSLKISGSITLNSDTSLVRVIVGTEDSLEYMVYESYPLIAVYNSFSFIDESDEASYLNTFIPSYLKIHITNASINIDSLVNNETYQNNLDSLQLVNKLLNDSLKVENINDYVQSKNWGWYAYTTNMSNKFFNEKKVFFGENYNLLGIDYYIGGIYSNYYLDLLQPSDASNLILEFDWRKKHDAHLPTSFYWDGDPNPNEEGNGWMTGIREQDCNSCSAYGAVATYEGFLYLYFNHHLHNLNQNEIRVSERDAFNCSWFYYMYVGCDCSSGKERTTILNYIVNDGVVNEECYPWSQSSSTFCEGQMNDCSEATYKCAESDYVFSANNRLYFSTSDYALYNYSSRSDYLKSLLIEHGPLLIQVSELFSSTLEHVVALVGFTTKENGQTVWIMKNSWGLDPIHCNLLPPQAECNAGYVYSPIPLEYNSNSISMRHAVYTFDKPEISYSSPLIPHFQNEQYDADKDGYWNWGLAQFNDISFTPPCDQQQDWNDNNNRIGPVDANYFGIPVQPGLEVYLGHPDLNGRLIENLSFCTFDDNDLTGSNELIIYIKNSGTAQLNLSDPPVEELSNDNDCFSLNITGINDEICHLDIDDKNLTQFTVTFDPLCSTLSTAKYKIDIHECDEDILGDFEFTLVYYDCADASGTRTIQHTETISGIEAENRDIIVESNASLTITSTLGMAPEGDIVVKPGGSLILDGGRITKLCDENWNGIDVWGDASLSQYPISNQGYLKVINGGCIEHAITGVQLTRLFNGVPSNNRNGGVIHCDSAIFKNNEADVIFYSYNNFDPNTLTKVPNRSAFQQTEFINDQICDKDIHVGLQSVDGIFFRGCTFQNSVDKVLQNCQAINKGTGIYSFNSGFRIIDECVNESTPCYSTKLCRFENLKYGIYALNAEFNEFIGIDTAVFYNTYRGIYMNLVDYPEIIRNQFIYDEDYDYLSTYDESYGLDIEHCGSFIVEQNVFANSSPINDMLGLQVLNAGPNALEIYNNSFNGFNTGITAAGNNRAADGSGLCIKCNDFIDCTNDIYVTNEGGVSGFFGIAFLQGDEAPQPPPNQDPNPTYAAGNTFSNISGDFTNYSNLEACYPIKYTYHGIFDNNLYKIIPNPRYPPSPSTHIDLIPDVFVEYDLKSEACPSNYNSGIDVNAELIMLSNESVLVAAYEDTLNIFVDGGDTEGLNLDVQLSFPDEAMEMRQELINNSPYLSDTVMLTSIEKENVLQNAMIRDVLVANPQSAKSPAVLNALGNRINPMPDYMMDEIMQGQSVFGSKELLEQELSGHKTLRDVSLNKVLRYYLSDTMNISASIDSIISTLQSRNYHKARYKLSMYYLNQHDSLNSFATIDSIPYEFFLTSDELIVHGLYIDLLENIWDIINDTIGIDSIHITALNQFADNPSLPGLYARNMLVNVGEFSYEEQVFLPNSLKVSPIWHSRNIRKTDSKLHVFPNPARNYFTIEYSVDKYYKDTWLILTDISGKHIKSIDVKGTKNQIIVPVQNIPSGIYVLQLFANDNLLESKKISISR